MNKRTTKNLSRNLIGIICLLSFFPLTPPPSQALDTSWIGGDGNWNIPSNWDNGVPQGTDHALLKSTDGLNRTVTYSATGNSFEMLNIDATGSGKMTLNITGGNFSITGPQDFIGWDGQGAVVQTSGTFANGSLIFGNSLTGNGNYDLSGIGNVSVNSFEYIGNYGIGVFNQSAGTHQLGTNMSLGAKDTGQGTYNLSGSGVLNVAGRENIGLYGNGVFNQNGGTNTAGDTIYIARYPGSTGIYNLNGGALNANGGLTNNDKFNFSAGILNADLTNNIGGTTTLSGAGTRTVNGSVFNYGNFKVTGTTAMFTGSFTNYDSSTYTSDPSISFFQDLYNYGSIVGGAGDEFHIGGNLMNYGLLNTSLSDLFFGSGSHQFHIGDNGSFSWDDMTLALGASLNLEGGATLHVNSLHVYDLAQINGQNLITYDYVDYLGTQPVPEPATMLLIGSGLLGLWGARRKFKK